MKNKLSVTKGVICVAKVLGLIAIEFMRNPKVLKKAQDEFEERSRDTAYVSPIPDGVKPPIDR